MYRVMLSVSEIPSASHAHWPLATTNNHLRPLPRGESCNTTTAYLHKHDSRTRYPVHGDRPSAENMTRSLAAVTRRTMRHAPASRQTRCTSTRGDKRNIRRPRSLSVRTPEHAGPAGTAAHELSLSCRGGGGTALIFASGAEPSTAHRPRPRSPLDKPQLATQATRISPPASTISLVDTKQKLLLETEFESMRLNEWERSTSSKQPVWQLESTQAQPMT